MALRLQLAADLRTDDIQLPDLHARIDALQRLSMLRAHLAGGLLRVRAAGGWTMSREEPKVCTCGLVDSPAARQLRAHRIDVGGVREGRLQRSRRR